MQLLVVLFMRIQPKTLALLWDLPKFAKQANFRQIVTKVLSFKQAEPISAQQACSL